MKKNIVRHTETFFYDNNTPIFEMDHSKTTSKNIAQK